MHIKISLYCTLVNVGTLDKQLVGLQLINKILAEAGIIFSFTQESRFWLVCAKWSVTGGGGLDRIQVKHTERRGARIENIPGTGRQ